MLQDIEKLQAWCKTAHTYCISVILRKNHVNKDWLIISILNTVIEKTIKAWKTESETDEWLGNLCKALKTKHWPTCFSHILSAVFKTKLPKKHYRCSIENSWEKRTQLSDQPRSQGRREPWERGCYQTWICDLPEIGCPVVKVENLYCQFFTSFTELILAEF